jgi:hypothetical protein
MPARALRASIAWLVRSLWLVLLAGILTQSTLALQDPVERVRTFTRPREFDFAGWTLAALGLKVEQSSLGASGYLAEPGRRELVLHYLDLIGQSDQLRSQIAEVYADPNTPDPAAATTAASGELRVLRQQMASLQPAAEAVLQEQVADTLASIGLGFGGETIPSVSFHFSQLPLALIVSPRSVVRQDANIDLNSDMTLEQQVGLEQSVESLPDSSALVVPIGGIGIYPTMIQETTALDWVAETVVHEWTHNYLTLRPLGLNYETSPELRTMNETTASLIGKAVGRMVLLRYYPDKAPPPEVDGGAAPAAPGEAPAFNFQVEMRDTRKTVDSLLATGRVADAEAYMDTRRRFFFDHGYIIRRLNQAYFAFYGAYADQAGGAAGEDPVGAAVRELWKRSPSPVEFLRTMAWMSSFTDLQRTLAAVQATH